MRPSVLDPLFAPVTSIDGVGPKLAALIAKIVPGDLAGREARIADLVFTLPPASFTRPVRPVNALCKRPAHAIAQLPARVPFMK